MWHTVCFALIVCMCVALSACWIWHKVGWKCYIDGSRRQGRRGSTHTLPTLQLLSPNSVVSTWKPWHIRDNGKRQEGRVRGGGGGGHGGWVMFEKRGKELKSWVLSGKITAALEFVLRVAPYKKREMWETHRVKGRPIHLLSHPTSYILILCGGGLC